MSLVLDVTDSITFERPLTRNNKQVIRVENPHPQDVIFKVKTTAPRIYCVRPNADLIRANSTIEVTIMHQPFKQEPGANEKCKDKFLFLSAFITETTRNMDINEFWTYVEANEKSSIHQHKLRCVFGPVLAEPAAPAASIEPVVPVESVSTDSTLVRDSSLEQNITPVQTQERAVETSSSADNEVAEKMRKMQEELDRYKNEVETLREKEPVVVEKVQVVKQSSNPFSIIILLALFVAAVAYFVKF